MRALVVIVAVIAAMLSCESARPGWVIEGELVGMELRPLPKRVVGQPQGQSLVVEVEPRVVSRGGVMQTERDWRFALAGHDRPGGSFYAFETSRRPFPALLAVGTDVRVSLDDEGFLVGVEAIP